jgi:hypothetical protein
MSAPSPAQVDAKAEQYYRLKAALDEATEQAKLKTRPLVLLKAELVELVSAYGSCHADKSKILHGVSEEMVATFGMSVTLDAAAIERFRLALVEEQQSRLLKLVFKQTIRWDMSPQAAVIVKGSKLSEPLLALYSQCQVVKDKAPSLAVREKAQRNALDR